MKALDLKILLLRTGIEQKEIAKDLRVSPAMVSYVCNGKERSKRIEEAIAAKLYMHADEIWPLVKVSLAA